MRRLSAFARDRGGVAAIEFAVIAPTMLVILFGLVEFPRAWGVNQAMSRAARTMADLISRGGTPDVNDVYAAGRAVSYPYESTTTRVVLTAVGVYKSGNALVARACSSAAVNTAARAANTAIGAPVPSEAVAGARYVLAEISLDFVPLLDFFPGLNRLTFTKSVAWPARGTGTDTNKETVMPGGRACPAS